MIEIGKLKKGPSALGADGIPFEMRYLRKRDLPQIMALQDVILGRLSRKDLLEAFSRDFMESHIGANGFIIGTFVQNALVAFRNVYFPDLKDREWNLGYDVGLETPEELEQVANLQMICVHPKFRGNSLGRQMNSHAIDIIRRLRRYTHLCATVSPYNYWNIRILLKSGFTLRTLKTKYNGKLRYVVYQNLTRAVEDLERNERIAVRLTDTERQKSLIHRGFIGVELREIDGFHPLGPADCANGFEVVFAASSPAESSFGRPPECITVTSRGSDGIHRTQ